MDYWQVNQENACAKLSIFFIPRYADRENLNKYLTEKAIPNDGHAFMSTCSLFYTLE